jgi:Na+/H+ antiporter NhaD/arsenite permease-like protein
MLIPTYDILIDKSIPFYGFFFILLSLFICFKNFIKIEISGKKNLFMIFLCNIITIFSLKSNGYIKYFGMTLVIFILTILYFLSNKEEQNKYLKQKHILKELFFTFFALFFGSLPIFLYFENLTTLIIDDKKIFWIVGITSSILDNTPSFLLGVKLFGGIKYLSLHKPEILKFLCLGSVFCGSWTYIGNGPNLLVLLKGKENNIKMPGFFLYSVISILITFPFFYYFI